MVKISFISDIFLMWYKGYFINYICLLICNDLTFLIHSFNKINFLKCNKVKTNNVAKKEKKRRKKKCKNI
jgi:hypothetical protein